MSDYTSPPEIARETLKRLAMERVAPTPDNYRAYYFRISGEKPEYVFPAAAFKRMLAAKMKIRIHRVADGPFAGIFRQTQQADALCFGNEHFLHLCR